MTSQKIRVLIVDDHEIFRHGLHLLLDTQPDIEVVGEAENGPVAVKLVQELRPDVVLLDVNMPGMNGIEASRAITRLGLPVRIVGLSIHENQEYLYSMLAAGASGYILKGARAAELAGAIRAVHEGGVYLTPLMAGEMVGQYLRDHTEGAPAKDDGLTAREQEVCRCIARGMTNQEIADALSLSVYTIQTHRAHIMRKLGLENRHQLIKYALQKGYAD